MKITVIGGAGVVGSAAAFHIATCGLAEEIVLVGRRENVVRHHAIDLGTAVGALGVKVRAGTYEDASGSALVINAAGVHQDITADRHEMLISNTALVKRVAGELRRHCPEAIVITATNPVDALNYATWQVTGFDRRRVIGYSLNDSLRFRERVALARGAEIDRVEGWVIGEHGFTQVPLFSSVRIGGQEVSLGENEKQRVRSEAPAFFARIEALEAGRTMGWTCAVGLAAMARAIADDTGEVFAGSVVLEGEYGQRGLSIGVPLRLGRLGVQEIVEWPLASDEKSAFELSADQVRRSLQTVDRSLEE